MPSEAVCPQPTQSWYSAEVEMPEISDVAGYEFLGWEVELPEGTEITDGSITMPNADVTVKGVWKAREKYVVQYAFESSDPEKQLPESVTEQLPEAEEHGNGDVVTPPALEEETVSVEGGVWTFDGWDYDTITVTGSMTVTGTWSFEAQRCIVSYEFRSSSDKGLPEEITDMLPDPEVKDYGTAATPPVPDKTRIETEDGGGEKEGVWVFEGWSPEKIDKLTKSQKFTGTWKYYHYLTVAAKDLTVYEGGLGSNGSTTTGDALPEPVWAEQLKDYKVTVDGTEWKVEEQGLPFAWRYADEQGNKVETSATVGIYDLYVYPKEELNGKDVVIDETYMLYLPNDGLQVGSVKVRDITNNDHADSLSAETFKNVYDYDSPQETPAASLRSRRAAFASLSEGSSALDGEFNVETGTHTDECDPREPHAHVYQGTTFLKNGDPDMPVGENAKIGLLWDDLLENVLGQPARMEKLHEKSLDALEENTFDLAGTIHKEFKYMDLVDMTDGNLWVGTKEKDVTVYYPYPEGVGKDDVIAVTWYEGLTRDYTIDMEEGALDQEINATKAAPVNNLRKTDTGILFDVPSKQFGPIEIMWQKSYTPQYEFVSGTKGKELPQAIQDLAPESGREYAEGAVITAPEVTEKEKKADDGVWTFQSWDAESKVSADGVKFTGTWTFVPNASAINHIPEIKAEDKIFAVGDPFHEEIALKDVTAQDDEDGDLTEKVKVYRHDVNTDIAGDYTITYVVTDSQGATSYKTVQVHVYPRMEPVNTPPVIQAEDKELAVGDSFDPRKDVTASDKEDGDLTAQIEIVENTVDTSKAGTYTVTYKVTDKDGASAIKTITVVVKDKEGQTVVPETPDQGENTDAVPPAETGNEQGTDSPATGDDTNLLLWSMIFALSSVSLIALAGMRKKRKNTEDC